MQSYGNCSTREISNEVWWWTACTIIQAQCTRRQYEWWKNDNDAWINVQWISCSKSASVETAVIKLQKIPRLVTKKPDKWNCTKVFTTTALTHHAIFNQFHNHASSCLVALCWSRYGTDSCWSTNILIFWFELYARSRLLLYLLYHITTFTNDDTDQTSRHWNLQ